MTGLCCMGCEDCLIAGMLATQSDPGTEKRQVHDDTVSQCETTRMRARTPDSQGRLHVSCWDRCMCHVCHVPCVHVRCETGCGCCSLACTLRVQSVGRCSFTILSRHASWHYSLLVRCIDSVLTTQVRDLRPQRTSDSCTHMHCVYRVTYT